MTIHLVGEYLIAILGLLVGAGVGLAVGAVPRAALSGWDAYATLPLLLAAAGAHLSLIGVVEPMRQVLFGLYGLALLGVAGFAALGWSIWRLGAILFPAGSIAAYFYFALSAHQADYVGLGVKLVELAAIAASLAVLIRPEARHSQRLLA